MERAAKMPKRSQPPHIPSRNGENGNNKQTNTGRIRPLVHRMQCSPGLRATLQRLNGAMPDGCALSCAYAQRAADNAQQSRRATDNVQRTTHCWPRAADNTQHTTYLDNVQQKTCSRHRAADSVEPTTCKRQHETFSRQHLTANQRLTTCK